MPNASRRDPDDLVGLAAALEALVGTEYEEQVFVWIDGTPEGHSLDVVHSADEVDGDLLPPTPDLVLPEGPGRGDEDEDISKDEDEWAESAGRYLVYVGYVPGVPFAERGVPVPDGTLLVDDDGTGATVALPDLPVAAVVELLGSWARSVLGGAAIGGLWWATTFEEDDEDEDEDEDSEAGSGGRNGDR
jgi:hypothetical protein